uniref:Uncharacterized protein n=1 Tax=Ditylenchus dipsaci TaxID=166011 RepID=A0A915EFM5_9BILA
MDLMECKRDAQVTLLVEKPKPRQIMSSVRKDTLRCYNCSCYVCNGSIRDDEFVTLNPHKHSRNYAHAKCYVAPSQTARLLKRDEGAVESQDQNKRIFKMWRRRLTNLERQLFTNSENLSDMTSKDLLQWAFTSRTGLKIPKQIYGSTLTKWSTKKVAAAKIAKEISIRLSMLSQAPDDDPQYKNYKMALPLQQYDQLYSTTGTIQPSDRQKGKNGSQEAVTLIYSCPVPPAGLKQEHDILRGRGVDHTLVVYDLNRASTKSSREPLAFEESFVNHQAKSHSYSTIFETNLSEKIFAVSWFYDDTNDCCELTDIRERSGFPSFHQCSHTTIWSLHRTYCWLFGSMSFPNLVSSLTDASLLKAWLKLELGWTTKM